MDKGMEGMVSVLLFLERQLESGVFLTQVGRWNARDYCKSSLRIGFRHPEMTRNVSFSAISIFLVWVCGTKLVRRIPRHCRPRPALKFAEQRRGHPTLSQPGDVTGNLPQRPSMCCLKVSWRSSVTPWYAGFWVQRMVVPLTVTASLGLDSLLFRMKAVHAIWAVLSLSLHANR